MAKKLQFVSEAVKKAQAKLQLQKKSLINLPPTKQALVRRALIVKNNRLRSKAVEDSKNRSDELKKFQESQGARWGVYWNTVRNEKKNRREDWFLGPLAPMRDSGIERYTYGTTSSRQVMGTAVLEEDKTKHIPFVKGDRVVVVSGRQKGKISTIVRIDVDSESAVLEGLEEVLLSLLQLDLL
jgi:large subunit ribosomal protein L24